MSNIARGGYVLRAAQSELRAVIIATGSEVALSEDHSAHAAFATQLLGRQKDDWSADVDAVRDSLPVIFMNGLQDPQVPEGTLREFRQDYDWIDYREYDDAGQLVFFRHWRDARDPGAAPLPYRVNRQYGN